MTLVSKILVFVQRVRRHPFAKGTPPGETAAGSAVSFYDPEMNPGLNEIPGIIPGGFSGFQTLIRTKMIQEV